MLLMFSRTAFRLYAHYNTHASHTCRELARSAAYKVVPIIPFPTTTQVLQSKDTFYPRVARVHSTIVCGGHEHFDRRVAIIRHRLSDLSSTGLRQLGGVMDVVMGSSLTWRLEEVLLLVGEDLAVRGRVGDAGEAVALAHLVVVEERAVRLRARERAGNAARGGRLEITSETCLDDDYEGGGNGANERRAPGRSSRR